MDWSIFENWKTLEKSRKNLHCDQKIHWETWKNSHASWNISVITKAKNFSRETSLQNNFHKTLQHREKKFFWKGDINDCIKAAKKNAHISVTNIGRKVSLYKFITYSKDQWMLDVFFNKVCIALKRHYICILSSFQ